MKHVMKHTLLTAVFVGLTLVGTSCATVFGGKVSSCQRTAPTAGQPQRQIRVAALVLDVLFFLPGAAIDFLTGAIYKPCTVASVNDNSRPLTATPTRPAPVVTPAAVTRPAPAPVAPARPAAPRKRKS